MHAIINYDDLVLLTAWMADNGFTAAEVAAAVEKPWHYHDELIAAAFNEAAMTTGP